MPRQTCFVIMGFGKKTDYSDTPRTLDLDATYEAIIEPAIKACKDLDCIRADRVLHSGIIDKPMYEYLLFADVVIADISTANANALYELGVRHALRPRATIIMKEVDGKFHFDLNHLATLQYKHLGDDIGAKEAKTKSEELRKLIEAIRDRAADDSPVYTFLPTLEQPKLPTASASGITPPAAGENRLATVIEAGRRFMAADDPAEACKCFEEALSIQTAAQAGLAAAGTPQAVVDPFVIQQLALATQRRKQPDVPTALRDAWAIIDRLTPATSTDPETLGIAGGIRKRLWKETNEPTDLDAAIELYGRGFEVKRDYYTGENYALCLDWRAARQADPTEAAYDRTTARKVRERVVGSLQAALSEKSAPERSDYRWMLATMSNTLRALARDGADAYEGQFRRIAPPGDVRTFEEGKHYALQLARRTT